MKDRAGLLWYGFCRMLCQVFCVTLFRIRVYGTKNVPDSGGAVVASNHQSYLDPVLIGVGLSRPINSMARESLFRNFLFRWLIRSLYAFPVRRGEMDVGAMKEAIRRVKADGLMLLFPEGTRTWDGNIGEVKRGIGLISRRARAPVVPAVIHGAFEAWPRRRKLFRPHEIKVAFGKPISVSEQDELSEDRLAAVIRERMLELREMLSGKDRGR